LKEVLTNSELQFNYYDSENSSIHIPIIKLDLPNEIWKIIFTFSQNKSDNLLIYSCVSRNWSQILHNLIIELYENKKTKYGKILRHFTHITHLNLSLHTKINNYAILPLKSITSLNLSHCNCHISDEGISHMVNLVSLDLSGILL
jgi:hypothetical protein